MSKRKIDVNQIKKLVVKGRNSSKAAKYQTVFSLFKQKEGRSPDMFTIRFPLLVRELLETLASYDLFSKIGTKDKIKVIDPQQNQILLQTYELKGFKLQYPIKQLMSCLFVKKQENKKPSIMLGIQQNKLILFFKKLREIYEQFCIGDKLLLQPNEYASFYQAFKSQWTRKQQKGRESNLQRLQKRLVRCLFAFIVLIENNILKSLDEKQKDQLRQNAEIGTKSEKKNIVKHNSAYSKNSTQLVSNFSLKPLSQHSYDQIQSIIKPDYSQKSLQLNTNNRKISLFQKAQIGNLKFRIQTSPLFQEDDNILMAPFINLLGDGVQNVLIEQAFRMNGRRRKLSEQLSNNQNLFLKMYSGVSDPMYVNSLYNYPHNYSQSFIPVPIQIPMVNIGIPYGTQDMQLHQLRRSMDFFSPIQMGMNLNKGVKSQISAPKTPRAGNKSNKSNKSTNIHS